MRMGIHLLILLFLLVGCTKKSEYRSFQGGIYGTTFSIIYDSDKDMDTSLRAEMEKVNRSLSMFDRNSIVSRVNRGETVVVDSLFIYLFQTAKVIFEETGGAFDITVAPLVNAWGFGYKTDNLPNKEQVDSLLLRVGLNKVHLKDKKIIKDVPGIELDASAIAKGLGVDLVATFLDRNQVKNYMVEIGGEVRVNGISDKKRAWRIGIDKPIRELPRRELQFIVAMNGGALATSGNYRNFYVKDGKRYAHTINPLSGYPIETELLSASVYTESCMIADAYATAFMVLGMERAKQIVNQNPELEVCLIYQEGEELKWWMSDGFKPLIIE